MKCYIILLTGILVALVLATGCTDENIPPPPNQHPADNILPGQVLFAVGDVIGDGIAGGTIDTITFTIGLVPGEKPVDLEKISIVYADTIRTETIVPVKSYHGEPSTGEWGILSVTNQIGNPNNRLEDEEQFVIRINPRAYLPANRLVTIVVRSPTGVPLTIRRLAPPTILAQNNILISL